MKRVLLFDLENATFGDIDEMQLELNHKYDELNQKHSITYDQFIAKVAFEYGINRKYAHLNNHTEKMSLEASIKDVYRCMQLNKLI